MRVLILGEGPTDLGRLESDGTLQLEGTLPILVRKLIAQVAPQTPIDIRAQKSTKKPRRFPESARRMGPSRYGYANRLRGLLALPEGREADAIVMVVDRDGDRHKDRIVELNKGREELKKANKPCAVGVAIEMIEAWLLADEKALRSCLEDHAIQRQPDPENLTGHDEASDHHPKGRLERLMALALGHDIPSSDFPFHYAAIALAAEVHVLEQRCPQGFQPFAAQVRALPGS
jgi:Domain of unknown function (DUF4276)